MDPSPTTADIGTMGCGVLIYKQHCLFVMCFMGSEVDRLHHTAILILTQNTSPCNT